MTPAAPAAPGGPRHLLVRANSLRLPVRSGSVHSVICSTPYFNLRQYNVPPTYWPRADYRPMPGLPSVAVPPMTCCLGNEESPEAFVGHLVLIFRDVWRCLHSSGSAFINLGDGYAATGKSGGGTQGQKWEDSGAITTGPRGGRWSPAPAGLKPLDLMGIPWRVAFALQADGWFLRAAPPWIKPGSAMPESCTSRPNVSHEMIFMLTKTSNYFFDMEQVRRSSAPATLERDRYSRVVQVGSKSHIPDGTEGPYGVQHDHETVSHPDGRHWRTSDFLMDSLDSAIAFHADRLAELEAARARGGLLGAEGGALPGAFLRNPQAYAGGHYASWPVKLVADMVKASTSEAGVCGGCGSPYERITERKTLRELADEARTWTVRPGAEGYGRAAGSTQLRDRTSGLSASNSHCAATPGVPEVHTLGWRPTCSCPAGTPIGRSVVLDPFGGSGCTAATAVALGRDAISVDLSPTYQSLARARVERPHKKLPRHRGRPAATPLFPEEIDEE